MQSYTDLPKSMIEADFISPNEFRVLAVLFSYSYHKKIFPSQEELVIKTGIKTTALKSALSQLCDLGIIVKSQRTGKIGHFSTNEYTFSKGGWNNWYEKKYGEYKISKYKTSSIDENEIAVVDAFSIKENAEPFVRCLNDFLYTDKLTSAELRVFLYLKEFANCDIIHPKYEQITKAVSISRPTAIATIKSLGEKELIKKIIVMRDVGGNTANEYLICNNTEIAEWLRQKTESK